MRWFGQQYERNLCGETFQALAIYGSSELTNGTEKNRKGGKKKEEKGTIINLL
jgi:hypothetical protein